MNLTHHYYYFKSVIPFRICDDIVRYGQQLQDQMAVTGGYGNFKKLNKFSNIIAQTYLVGENANKIKKHINRQLPNKVCESLKEALERSYNKSLSSGKLYPILFSPASASFDNYKSFEERGDCFKKLFKNIRKKVA